MIAYSQCWEDASLLIKALQIAENDVVLSVTSGGCNTLAIAGMNPSMIYSIDKNRTQNYLLELKMAAILNLNRDNTIAFLGYRSCSNRSEIFQTLAPFLSKDSILFWNDNINCIVKGVVHCGKFERYLHAFRRFILPGIHGKKTIHELVKPKSKAKQEQFYVEKWNSFKWKLLFKIFFSRTVMSGRGRIRQMFAHTNSQSIAAIYSKRVKKAFMRGIISRNFYLNYILFKQFDELPLYLEKYEKINDSSIAGIKIVHKDILTFLQSLPDESITKFNLSDIFEPVSQEEMDMIVHEIYRVSKPNSRLIFWNNLVERNISKEMLKFFMRDVQVENELRKHDKVFFYACFYIYIVKK